MIPQKPFYSRSCGKTKGKKMQGALTVLCVALALTASSRLHAEEVPIDVDADDLQMDKANQGMVAKGNVIVEQKGLFKLQADEARYNGENNVISAKGSIKLFHKGDMFLSDKIKLNIETKQGEMDNVTMDMEGPGGRGGAKKVLLTDEKTMEMTDAWYTNCDCEEPPWHLAADKITVNHEENNVEARGMNLFLGKVPVLYFPWWSQPLRPERKSGFLIPDVRFSSSNGMELEIPYYWNIAPDRDMTVALRGIGKRGLMGKAEYRYLGLGYNGEISTQQIYDTKEDEYRGLTKITHEHRVGGWDLSLLGQRSKTRDFINDFDQDLVDGNARRLESHLKVDRQWIRTDSYTDAEAGVLWYQDLEQTNDDYTIQRLPYIALSDNRPIADIADGRRWRLQSDVRVDSFYQMSGDAVQRLDLAPTVRYNRPLDIGHFSARFGLRETAYLIQGDPNQSGMDRDNAEHREASLASFRLDTKLEKTLSGNMLHTIEPSVEYVINATTSQGDLPNYDSTLRNFSTSNLFINDQYSGVDRISNGQWVSYGLTTRLISLIPDNSIMETATFKIGQRWAPSSDREYHDGNAVSNIVTSLDLNLAGGWSAHANNRYNPHTEEVMRTDADIVYTRHNDDKIGLGYHFNQPSTIALTEDGSARLEDVTLNAELHLTKDWLYTQRADYSIENSGIKSWETILEYEEDCWTLGFKAGRKLLADVDGSDYNGSYFGLVFSLRGLGEYGK